MSLSGAEKRARLEKALEYGGGTHTVEDVVDLLRADPNEERIKLFEFRDGVIVAEVNEYPRLRAVHFWLLAGSLRDVLALEHEVIPWGLERGCTVATATGRRGWGRVSSATGWKPHMFTFYKELLHG
jgi:hypothetical protein